MQFVISDPTNLVEYKSSVYDVTIVIQWVAFCAILCFFINIFKPCYATMPKLLFCFLQETTQITCNIPPKPSEGGENTEGEQKIVNKTISKIAHLHVDIIKDEFWKSRPHLLGDES